MYKSVNETEFLAIIRGLDERLKSIKLSNIEIDRAGQTVQYNFICDQTVDDELKQKILAETEKISPPAFQRVKIVVKKIVSTKDLVSVEIFKYINDNFPSIAIFVKPTDVITTEVGDVVKYVLRLDKDSANYATRGGVIRKINEHLSRNFCSNFVGSTEIKELEETVDLLKDEVFNYEIQKVEHRTIKVQNVVVIDDRAMGDVALYIEDALNGKVTVCGVITEINERQTKTGKPFFIIRIDDTTGRIGGAYFTKKYSLDKIRGLKVGDAIIASGTIGEYNGRSNFTFERINACTFPSDFVKKEKFKKSAPTEYRLIFPEPATATVKVDSVFDDEIPLPEEVINTDYVVFDLETTGTDVLSSGITEIGAVRIKGGKIVEHFTSLIKPDYPISKQITELTGIDEEMVKDAPKIPAVIPDFMKFIEGSVLIAQNASFDMKFIKRFAEAEEYSIANKVLDTLEMGRKLLRQLAHHDLHTMADHFGIVFRHHRALSDAYATAQLFLELTKLQSKSGK